MLKNSVSQYKMSEIDKFYALKSWWTVFLVLPLSKLLSLFLLNKTKVSANIVTITAVLLRLLCIAFFLNSLFSLGAISFFGAHLLDCIDGVIARATGSSTDFGRYLDHVSDLVGDIGILIALALNQGLLLQPFIWAMVLLHMAESYISYLAGFSFNQHEGTLDNFVLFLWFNRYRQWWFNRNIKSFISFPDYTAVVFVLFPLLGMPSLGLKSGFYLLLLVVSYTVFSTFVSLHTTVKQFP